MDKFRSTRMTQKAFIAILCVVFCIIQKASFAQDKYFTKTGFASFYSYALLEDIKAENNKVGVLLNTLTGDLTIRMSIRGFKFEKGLMEEHFNENYMESDQFKEGAFYGKIDSLPNLSVLGVYEVSAIGKLHIHGVEIDRKIPGTLTIEQEKLTIVCEFKVPLKEHNIKIEGSKLMNISEEIEVKFNAELIPYVKK